MNEILIPKRIQHIATLVINALEDYAGFDSWWDGISHEDKSIILSDIQNKLEKYFEVE